MPLKLIGKLILILTMTSRLVAQQATPTERLGQNRSSIQPKIELASDFGNRDPTNLKICLTHVVDVMSPYVPERRLANIQVHPASQGRPQTLYSKTDEGNYKVLLAGNGPMWSGYIYQFSHEFAHILCNYELRNGGDKQWFEEAICETASIFVSKRIYSRFTNSNDPSWQEYGKASTAWLNEALLDPARHLPPEYSFPAWYRDNAAALRLESEVTPRSRLVSTYLLPIFEEDPSGWQSLQWINLDKQDASLPFMEYLAAWKSRCPPEHRKFVARIENLFKVSK